MEQAPPTVQEQGRRGVTLALAFSMLLASLGTSIANIALPTIGTAFSASFSHVQWVVVAYLAALTCSVVAAGRLGDLRGLKRMILVGLALFAIASLICGIAPTLWLLICGRVLQGIGAAFLMTLSMALMRELASPERLGRAMGLLGTVSALGTALGPSLGGVLIPLAGWRAVFLVLIPLATLAFVLALIALPQDEAVKRVPPPRLRTMLSGGLMPNLIVNLLVAAVMMTTLIVGPFYLSLRLGLSDVLVGSVMSVGPVISIFSGTPSGRLVDAYGTKRVLALGLGLLVCGAFLLAFLPNLLGVPGYLFAIVVLTPGYQLFQAANNTAALVDVPKDRRGTVSGLLSLFRNIGHIVGASVMGATFAIAAGTSDFSHASSIALAVGMRATFILAGALMVVAAAVSFVRVRRGTHHQAEVPRR